MGKIRLEQLDPEAAADGSAVVYDSASGALVASDVMRVIKTVTFSAELDNGSSGAAKTIDWTAAQKQKLTLTAGTTLTFTAPLGATNVMLKIVQDATARTVTWPASVKWANGATPDLTTINATYLVAFYFDGTDYFGVGGPGFS